MDVGSARKNDENVGLSVGKISWIGGRMALIRKAGTVKTRTRIRVGCAECQDRELRIADRIEAFAEAL